MDNIQATLDVIERYAQLRYPDDRVCRMAFENGVLRSVIRQLSEGENHLELNEIMEYYQRQNSVLEKL